MEVGDKVNLVTFTLSEDEYDLIYEALSCYEAELLLKSGRLSRIGQTEMARHYADKRKRAQNLIRFKFDTGKEEKR